MSDKSVLFDETAVRTARRFRWAMAVAMAALATGLMLLCRNDTAVYARVMGWLSVRIAGDSFLDWRYVAAQVECWQHGVDVYAATPCDVFARPMDYSPVLLRLSSLPTARDGVTWTAVAVDLLGCAALLALPVAVSRRGRLVMAAAMLSPVTLFAFERANIDVLVLAGLVLAALTLTRHGAARALAHGLIVLAALAKFYPAVAGLAVLRERRPATIAGAALAYAAVLGGFAAMFAPEIARTLANVPSKMVLEPGVFGAPIMPSVTALIVQQVAAPGTPLHDVRAPLLPAFAALRQMLLVGALAMSALVSWRLARRAGPTPVPDPADSGAALFLLFGLVTAGCFLLGYNIHYRAIMAIPMLPLLLRMARNGDCRERRIGTAAAALTLTLMWLPAVEWPVFEHRFPLPIDTFALVVTREALWWSFVTVVDALLLRMVTAHIAAVLGDLRGGWLHRATPST